MLRVVQNLLRRPPLHNLTFIHHSHIVGNLGYHPKVMRDENNTYIMPLLQRPQQLQNSLLHRNIQRRGRLVGDK